MYQREQTAAFSFFSKNKRLKRYKMDISNRELTTDKIMNILLEITLKITIICTNRILHLLQNYVPTSKILIKHCFIQHLPYKIIAEEEK
jgi:hypothetical protein